LGALQVNGSCSLGATSLSVPLYLWGALGPPADSHRRLPALVLDDARTVVMLLRQLIGHRGKAAGSVVLLQHERIYR